MVYGFRIDNNYNNQTKDVDWSFNIGNGTIVTNNESITLESKENIFVYFEQNYPDGDLYELNATATSGDLSDSETMSLYIGDVIAYDLVNLFSLSMQRIFSFSIFNNFPNLTGMSWSINTGEVVIDAAEGSAYLDTGEEIFVYVEYNYSSGWSYVVNASGKNDSISDDTLNVEVSV